MVHWPNMSWAPGLSPHLTLPKSYMEPNNSDREPARNINAALDSLFFLPKKVEVADLRLTALSSYGYICRSEQGK